MEFIIDTSNIKRVEIVRCRDCVMSEESESGPAFIYCGFWEKMIPLNGYCYIGQKGEKNEL